MLRGTTQIPTDEKRAVDSLYPVTWADVFPYSPGNGVRESRSGVNFGGLRTEARLQPVAGPL